MDIKVFISQPREEDASSKLHELASRLDSIKDGINKVYMGRYPSGSESDVKCYADNILAISNCDVVVLADRAENDERCRWEEHLANELHIPVCREDEFSRVVRDRITELLNGAGAPHHNIFSSIRQKAGIALAGLVDLRKSQCDISQDTFVIEECSELIKELTKNQRGKSSKNDIVSEACDVITSVLVLFRLMHVPEEHVYEQIEYKCNRAVQRFKETGKF